MNEREDLEEQIAQWRSFLRRHNAVSGSDIDELEDHLRGQIVDLAKAGLDADEAFLVAVKRMGSLDDLSREFAREHSERLWKQLVLTPETDATRSHARREIGAVMGFAVAAAAVVKAPELFGRHMPTDEEFYFRNAPLLVLTVLALYFVWKRRLPTRSLIGLAVPFVLGATLVNAYPFEPDADTAALATAHLFVVLWLTIGVAYQEGDWRLPTRRMDFVRFTGEWFIYYVLIALGGGVLIGLTVGTFQAIGLDATEFVQLWLAPCGAAAAVIVAAWLVEAKQSVIENMAPVLTRVFTPLFAAMLLASVVAALWTGNGIDVGREVLILFDFLLILVLGLFLYSISAQSAESRAGINDILRLVLLCAALALDGLALAAILGRIGQFGFTPNRTAALGLNLILLVNLAWSTWLSFGFQRNRRTFDALERWQTSYMPLYAVWAALVVVVFPPLFGFA